MMPKPTIWTDEEIEVLKEHYPYSTQEKILELLSDKSWSSIMHKMKTLKIKRMVMTRPDGTVVRRWSQEEVEKLKDIYPKTPDSKLSDIFDRELKTIKNKAHYLKLKKNEDIQEVDEKDRRKKISKWTDEEKEIMYRYYPIEGSVGVHKRIPRLSRETISSQASRWGLSAPQEFVWKVKSLDFDSDNIFTVKAKVERVN